MHNPREPTLAKFMLSMGDQYSQLLVTEAKSRGITIQELIRAVIVPDWARENLQGPPNNPSVPVRYSAPQYGEAHRLVQTIPRRGQTPAKS